MATFRVKSGQKFLFIGDSITDAGHMGSERPYGMGYVSLFIELQRAMFPRVAVNYVNRGISGNTVLDLRNRWTDAVIREKPDWLSVKIGINDVHRFLAGTKELGPDEFRLNYDAILTETRKRLKAELILVDPFYISTDKAGLGARTQVLTLLPKYIDIVHEMARKHRARLVRTHDMFQNHLKYVAPDFFCPEPVHPFRSGHLAIALEIMKAVTADGRR